MIYVLAAIILTPVSVVVFARWFKRQVELVNPSCDNEGEVEDFLASRLELALAKDAA
ncbi:hypothetical protein R1538_34770 [Rhizobium leguminosarum]|uniref:hypothetical protein n=1 Tax=Rhizobium leguminosarum TaxID=384 RepID=UPI00293DC90D|nr:hypothetical protein [Rhizobium leguminosarum]MDV4166216.1 hypothetical protein [Rhizobium leguminosarum]